MRPRVKTSHVFLRGIIIGLALTFIFMIPFEIFVLPELWPWIVIPVSWVVGGISGTVGMLYAIARWGQD